MRVAQRATSTSLLGWVANDPESVSAIIADVLGIAREDGISFGATSAETIREEDDYSGVRVTMPCALASARLTFHVDVNVGDVIWPAPVELAVPRLLFLRGVAASGGGIATLPSFIAQPYVASGDLVRVLPSVRVSVGGLVLLYSSTRPLARKVAAFRDFLVEVVQREWVG